MRFLAGMLDANGWRVHQQNFDGTWRASNGNQDAQKWRPSGIDTIDPANSGCLLALLLSRQPEVFSLAFEDSRWVVIFDNKSVSGERLNDCLLKLLDE